MTDYRLTIKISNGRIAKMMDARGIKTAKELSRAAGVETQYPTLAAILTLKLSPLNGKTGEWRPVVQKLADFFQVMPDDMFSPRQLRAMGKTVALMDMSEGQIEAVIGHQGSTMLDDLVAKDFVAKALHVLTDREARIITARFGLGDDQDHTLAEVGRELSIVGTRVQQIESRSIRKMRYHFGKEWIGLQKGKP